MAHNVTKSVTFFIFSTDRLMLQQHELLAQYLELNVCFHTLFFVSILGLNNLTQNYTIDKVSSTE